MSPWSKDIVSKNMMDILNSEAEHQPDLKSVYHLNFSLWNFLSPLQPSENGAAHTRTHTHTHTRIKPPIVYATTPAI